MNATSPELTKDDTLELPIGQPIVFKYPDNLILTLECKIDHTITATLAVAGGAEIATLTNHTLGVSGDFSYSNPLTIGRRGGMTLSIPENYKQVSGEQASIQLKGENIIYTHLGRTPIKNPLHQKQEIVDSEPVEGKIETADVPAGGFTTRNPNPTNTRDSNEDRAGVFRATLKPASEAIAFLNHLFDDTISAVQKCDGNSTLSMAMSTDGGAYACAYMGDSPFYLVGKNKITGEVILEQMLYPHTSLLPEAMRTLGQRILTSYKTRELLGSVDRESRKVTSGLKALSQLALRGLYVIDPTYEFSEDIECLGLMVCSDGIESGVKQGDVQGALTTLLQSNAQATPAEICESAVNAAVRTSTDNITATFLPMGAKALVAVGDGFEDSGHTADVAIKAIRSKCPQPIITARSDRTPEGR